MLVRFSQKWAKTEYSARLRELIRFVKGSRSAPDLLVKIFFYTSPRPMGAHNGHYRNSRIHGFHASESELPFVNGVTNIITLKMSTKVSMCSDLDIWKVGEEIPDIKPFGKYGEVYLDIAPEELERLFIEIFAHEFKHYLDMRHLSSLEKYRHWERRADKFSSKIVKKWKGSTEEKA